MRHIPMHFAPKICGDLAAVQDYNYSFYYYMLCLSYVEYVLTKWSGSTARVSNYHCSVAYYY